jgi:uncharacterized repeat protein (TIGR02543 family)
MILFLSGCPVEPMRFKVVFDSNGGSGTMAELNLRENKLITLPPNTFTKDQYDFTGWATTSTGAVLYSNQGFFTMFSSDVTLYAKWAPSSYTVTLDTRDGIGGSRTVTATYGAEMPPATAPTRVGYIFSGYYDDLGGTGTQYYTDAMASGHDWDKEVATTLYAKWTGRTYVVTFNDHGGSGGSGTVNATYGMEMPVAIAPIRVGYSFKGYYYDDDNEFGTEYYTDVMASVRNWDKAAATTLHARWAGKNYTVTLDNQGGSGGSDMVTATYGSEMPAATAPTHISMKFGGYYDEENGNGTQYYTNTMASSHNWDKSTPTTLYAKWIAYNINEIGPAGGYIFLDMGNYTRGWRYMEAAPSDLLVGESDYDHIFGYHRNPSGEETLLVGTQTGIGTGQANTTALVSAMGSEAYTSGTSNVTTKTAEYAAKLCDDLVIGAYDDWFLPSKDELYQLYLKHHMINGFISYQYWSSSEVDMYSTNLLNFNDGKWLNFSRSAGSRVRPVRAF